MKAILAKDPVCQWLLGRASAYSFLSKVGWHNEGQRAHLRTLMRISSKGAIAHAKFILAWKGAV
jgi:hypothetical protein